VTATAHAELAELLAGDRGQLAVLVPPLPRPSSPHRLTMWGDRLGRTHRTCSCSPDADPAAPACVDFSRLLDLLHRTLGLATARHDVRPRSWPEPEHPGPLKAAALRQRGMALLGLIVAAGGRALPEPEPSPAAETDASLRDPGDASEHGTAPRPEPEPVSDRGGQQVPQVGRAAEAVHGAEPDATPEPAEPAAGAPWRPWYSPSWQRPPRCPVCTQHHYGRWAGGGHARPCTRADPVTATYEVCRVCGWTIDPVAAAEYQGRHPECALPPAELAHWQSIVRERERARRTAERTAP
jgi:hypothetical protein